MKARGENGIDSVLPGGLEAGVSTVLVPEDACASRHVAVDLNSEWIE